MNDQVYYKRLADHDHRQRALASNNGSGAAGDGAGRRGLAHERDQLPAVFDGVFQWIEASNQKRGDAEFPVIEQGLGHLLGGTDQSRRVAARTRERGDLGLNTELDLLCAPETRRRGADLRDRFSRLREGLAPKRMHVCVPTSDRDRLIR